MNANTEDNRNSQVILRQVPTGLLGPDDFEVRQAPMPTAGDGEVVVEAHYLSLDAALRLIVRDSKDFLFRVEPGDLVRNSVAGRVVESNNPDWAAGDYVVAATGVQNYGISDGSDLELCDITQAPLSAWLGGFGVSGLTAYFAIFDECKPQPGQTVVINGAAGAVGTMAGQFAKMAGALVIGIAGGPEKCKWLVDELGFDAAVDYKDGDLYEKLVEAAPD
jgi:NADPH-dependent curcumin reductase CurA